MLLLVNASLYGNTPVKENILKKIIYFLCPCAKKNTIKVHAFRPIHRVEASSDLLNVYTSNPITDRHRKQLQDLLEQVDDTPMAPNRDRDFLKVPVEAFEVQ